MKILSTLTLASLGLLSSVHASTLLGFGVEADSFHPDVKGSFLHTGTPNVQATLDHSTSVMQYALFLEHPLPLIPNIRIDLTPSIDVAGTTAGETLTLKQTDMTAYYELIDTFIDVDVGLSAKTASGTVVAAGNSHTYNVTIPMGYLSATLPIPSTGVKLQGSMKYITFSGNSVTDAKIKMGVNLLGGLELQGGYRYEKIKIDDLVNVTSDIKIQGPFVGLGYTF